MKITIRSTVLIANVFATTCLGAGAALLAFVVSDSFIIAGIAAAVIGTLYIGSGGFGLTINGKAF